MQQTDFTSVNKDGGGITQLKLLLGHFDQHARVQEEFIFSAIRQKDPGLIEIFEQEHTIEKEMNMQITNLLKDLDHAIESERKSIGAVINQSFMNFMIFSLQHMAKEEEHINRILWHYWSDNELLGMRGKIMGAIPRQQITEYNKWIIRGLNISEITGWLKEIKNNMPALIFQSVLDAAATELS
ncbi:MAG TPA: hypothetical protein VK498_07405, partial [Ferruginibacter sp.]|nr:hypothetical protein [Ferruginibacter sp.]